MFIVPGLPIGGAERHTVDLRARLDRLGFTTHLLVHGPRRSPSMLAHPGAANATFLDLKGMSDIRGWFQVRAALKRARPDVIVAVNQTPLIVAAFIRLLGGVRSRVFCIFHTTLLRKNEKRMFFLFRWALRVSDVLVFVSQNQSQYWKARGLKCREDAVVLNGIDIDYFRLDPRERQERRRSLWFEDRDIVVGLSATFRVEKSHETLIKALASTTRRGLPIKLLLIGDGPTKGSIEDMVREAGLGESVVFVGEMSDVRPFLAACDVGVLCSVAVETFSLSALEFLAMGVPMIMSRIGGATEIVTDGENGFLFEAGDVDGLAEKLALICDRATLDRLSENARPSVERLAIGNMVENYAKLFSAEV